MAKRTEIIAGLMNYAEAATPVVNKPSPINILRGCIAIGGGIMAEPPRCQSVTRDER